MIYVDYGYIRKSDGVPCTATKEFYSTNKAIRFIYMVNGKPNMWYDGFTCDDSEELEEMNRKL